ncbi:MAG: hypothetical protein ABL888_00645 [Pirellulaceae bacterium]
MSDHIENEDITDIGDGWDEFRCEDQDPIRLSELAALDMATMPEDVLIRVMDDYFPDAAITRVGDKLVCHIEDHMYTKYWEHRYSAYAFAEAMERAIVRLTREGHPFANPERDDDDVHIFVRWDLILSGDTPAAEVGESIRAANELVSRRADSILENSDSVLVLGKDTGPSLDLLKRIAARLETHGYFTYIIKEQPDRTGESVIQKVMRHALMCKFVIVENTEPSGHLYEIPHAAKAAECVTVVLQQEGKGATWMFEDAYGKHRHWHKVEYSDVDAAVDASIDWAEHFIAEFGKFQQSVLPWMRAKP